MTNLYYLKSHSTTAVGGEAVALRYFPGDPDEGNLDRGFAGLVVDNPFAYTEDDEALAGTILFEKDEGETATTSSPSTWTSAQPNRSNVRWVTFTGTGSTALKSSRSATVQSISKPAGRAGWSATCCLDVHGKGGAEVATNDDGSMKLNDNGYPVVVPALLEYFDNDADSYTPPRFYRDTQLRPDMEGETVLFMVQRMRDVKEDYDGDSYWSTVLHQTTDDDGETVMTSVSPTTEFEPDEDLLRATSWLEGRPTCGSYSTSLISALRGPLIGGNSMDLYIRYLLHGESVSLNSSACLESASDSRRK